MNDISKFKDYVLGMFLSVASYEVWQSVLTSLLVAFVGGFLAAAGKGFYVSLREWRRRKKG